jgi:hypothetical protein
MLVLGTIGFSDDSLLIRINSLRGSYPQGSQMRISLKNSFIRFCLKKKVFFTLYSLFSGLEERPKRVHI